MEYKIINTGDYLLIIDDSEIKKLKWVFNNISNEIYLSIDTHMDYQYKIIAHLPLNNSPILEGVPLLPPIEDEVEKLAKNFAKESGERYSYEDFKAGYNKAKEKYKYTEEDLRKAIEMRKEFQLDQGLIPWYKHQIDDIIKSLQQPKMPVGVECEMVQKSVNGSIPVNQEWEYEPKTTTNSQGLTQWVGEYIY